MKVFRFNITELMYRDIFDKKMPEEFFEGLEFVGGNTFQISLDDFRLVSDNKGKIVPFYEMEEKVTSILEKYGCNWQEDGDQTTDGSSGRQRNKRTRPDVPKVSWG